MAKYSNVVEYNIITDVDTSGITKLQNELVKLKQSLKFDKDSFKALGFDNAKIDQSIKKVNQLQNALTTAFNPKIGTLDLSKLNTSLQKEHTNLQMIVKDWEQMGARGNLAISSLSNALLSMNKGAVTVNTTLSKIANTFGNTVRWGITASIFQEMMGSIQGAVSYMKDLDESLTQIQMVTNSSKEDMRELAQYANNAAQALGSTTTDYTNAVKVFVQEGFSEKESKQYANLSTKLANVSEQNTATTSDQITAFRNAFQLDYEQTVAAMDKVANVANNTASNVNELMTASQRAASVAQAVGASQDSFLASIATIESVTRQSAEEIGNGLKTIYQRFADIQVSGSTEDGVDYGQYAQALKSIGVDVLDAAGEFKGMDQILQETQEVWSSLSDTMKVAVGEKVAGKFQYNRFAALMNNPEYYQKALGATQNADGMMDQMNEYYMDSIEGRMKTLQAAGEQVMSTLFNQDDVEPVIETLTDVVNAINDIVDAAGGLQGVLPIIGGLLMRTFSSQIASTITNIANSIGTVVANSRNANQLQTTVNLVGLDKYTQSNKSGSVAGKLVSQVANNYDKLSIQTKEKLSNLTQQIVELEEQKNNVLIEQKKFLDNINENAKEEKILKQEKLSLVEEEITLLIEEIEATGKATASQKKQLEKLQGQAWALEDEIVAYDKINKECKIYLEQLNSGKGLTADQVQEVKQWREEASHLGIQIESLVKLVEQLDTAESNLDVGKKMGGALISSANLEARLNSITKILGTISSLSIGITMITDSIKVLSDESATAEEKFKAFTLDGLMGITMVLPVFTELIKTFKTAKEGSLAFAAAEKIRALATMEANGAMLLNPVVLGIMAAIAAAALAIAVAYEAIYGAVNKANRELENQRKILEQTKDSYKALNEKIDDFNTRMESISDVKQSLSEMAKGTEEWRDKVAELNDQIYELLEAYPELIEYVKSEDGALSIDTENEDYKKYVANLKNQKLQAKQSNLLQQNNVKAAENNAQWESFKLKYGDIGLTLDDISNKSMDELKKSIDDSRTDYDNIISALTDLKQTVDKNNAYLNNVNSTVANSFGFTNYAGTKISDYENPDLSQYQTVSQRTVKTLSSTGRNTFPWQVSRTNEPTQTAEITQWKTDNEDFKKAIEQYHSDLKNITEIVSHNDGTISFKYTNEDGKLEDKTDKKEEVEQALKLYAQTSQYMSDTLAENISIFKLFGATFDDATQEFKDSAGNVITSFDELESVTEEQAAIMNKMTDGTYSDYMKTLYGSAEEFAKMVANGKYADSEFKDREAGLTAFTESQRLEGLYGDQYQSIIEGLKSEFGSTHKGEDILSKYNNFESIEDFTRAIKDGTISLDGLSEALDKLTPDIANLTTNINGNQFTNRVDLSSNEDAFKSFLEDSGMTEGAFNRMSRDAYEEEGGYYQEEKERLEELIAEKEKHANITEKEKEEIAGLKSEMEDLDDAAKDSTAMILRMSNGVVNLRNKIEDISEILTNEALEGTTEWYEALDDLDKGLSEVLNIDAGTLSDEFIESGDALDYARRMAEGDMTAIDDLRRAASEDIIQNLTIQANTQEDVDRIRGELLSELNQLQTEIDSGAITVKSDLDKEPFIQKLNEMLEAGQISAEQASNILSSIGMDAKIDYVEGDGTIPAIAYKIGWVDGLPGFEPVSTDIPAKVKFPVIRGAHYTGSGVQTANTAASNPSYTGGYSNNPKPSSSSPKSSTPKVEKPKNVEEKKNAKNEWDYLTDITNDLERASAAVEKLAKLEDRLFGKNRVSQIRKLQGEYKNYIGLLEQESKLAKEHARRLRTRAHDENGNLTINGYANRAGFGQISFDSKGNLENGKEIEAALTQRLNNAINDYNAHRNEDDASWYDDQVKHAQEEHDGFMKAMSDYQDTLKTIEDSEDQIQEYKEKIQDAADEIVDAILEGVDKVIETNDKRRDFDRSVREWREGGKGYSHFKSDRQYYSEGLQKFLNPKLGINGQSTFDFSLSNLKKRYADAEDVFDINGKDKKRADDEKLSQTQALENLSEATEKVVNELNSMTEYYNSLLDTVEEMSSKMDDIIENRLQQYDNIEDFLDGRLDQLKLLFGEDYGAQVKFYNQKIDNNMSKMVDINTAIEAKQATVKQLEKLESSDRELSAEERQMLKDARDEVNKLQREQMATETKLLQDIASKLSAGTRGEMKKAINDMFGGNDVEWIAQQWEIASRNSSQYLDDYNRAFELQKLQLKYQDLLNDTQETSLSIQQRISTHMNDQLGFLRNKKKLSEYDIQYAQKQLDILQKQIALEEARDNKSQMRLQRNAAGNYDFVYAADEDAINQATEALLNAQQEAYNLSKKIYLDTYNSAVEAALKTKETVVEIALDASLDTAEKQERIKYVLDNLKEYMDNSSIELKNISVNLYNDFIEADNKIAEENLGALSEVYQKIKDEYVKSLGTMTESSKNATDSMKEHLGAFLGEEGEEQTSGTARYVFNQFETLGNTSFSNLVQNSDGTWSNISENIKSTLNDKIAPDLNDMFGEQGTLAKYFSDTGIYSNNLWNGLSTHIEKTVLPKITNDMKSTFLESGGKGSDSIEGIVSLALSSIDSNFKLTEIKSLEKISSIDSAIDIAYANIRKYLGEYRQENNEALEEMGTSYGTFVSDSLEVAKEATDNLKGSTDEFKGSLEFLKDEIKNTTTEIGYWKTALDNAYTASQHIIDQSYYFQTALYEDQAAAAAFADELDRIASNSDLSVTTTYTEDHNINYNYSMSGDIPAGTTIESVDSSSSYGNSYEDTYGGGGSNSSDYSATHYSVHGFGGGMMFRTTSYAAAQAYKENHSRPGMPLTIKVGQWDTGGYTGTWTDRGIDDKNGKLAILHQKELVLNAADTENMLSAVEIVRDIMSGVNNLTSFGKSISNSSNFNDTIEQRVEISATFPGVTTALEIERALTELADNAYQYSHKYKY